MIRKIIYLLIFTFATFAFSCNNGDEGVGQQDRDVSYISVIKRGRLRAAIDYNSTNYFLYKGQPMGFQYELLQAYAEHLGVSLELLVSNDLEDKFQLLEKGKCDLIAINLTVTAERSKRVAFTVPHAESRQVLVQRKPEGWRGMSSRKMEKELIRNQLELAEKFIYIQKNSSFEARLRNLIEEIGDTIYIVDTTEYGAEELISMVSEGLIDYTVADENVALVNQTYYPNLDVQTAISFPQKLAWAVKLDADSLKSDINRWLTEYKESQKFKRLYNKYFKSSKYTLIVNSEYYSLNGGKISQFDDLFRKYAPEVGWDWRLLAALCYQESSFDPEAVSWAGAIGLMQLMPETGKRFGADSLLDPEQNIAAGVKFLKYLDDKFKGEIKDEKERYKFILASYNVGIGHIYDAQNLAEKYGKERDLWEGNVALYLKKKAEKKYYLDPDVRNGYCKGEWPCSFTSEILDRYEHYKNTIPL